MNKNFFAKFLPLQILGIIIALMMTALVATTPVAAQTEMPTATPPATTGTTVNSLFGSWNSAGTTWRMYQLPETQEALKRLLDPGATYKCTPYMKEHGCIDLNEVEFTQQVDGSWTWNTKDGEWTVIYNRLPTMQDGWVSNNDPRNPVAEQFKISGNYRGFAEEGDGCGRTQEELGTWQQPADHRFTGVPAGVVAPVQGMTLQNETRYGVSFDHGRSTMPQCHELLQRLYELTLFDPNAPEPTLAPPTAPAGATQAPLDPTAPPAGTPATEATDPAVVYDAEYAREVCGDRSVDSFNPATGQVECARIGVDEPPVAPPGLAGLPWWVPPAVATVLAVLLLSMAIRLIRWNRSIARSIMGGLIGLALVIWAVAGSLADLAWTPWPALLWFIVGIAIMAYAVFDLFRDRFVGLWYRIFPPRVVAAPPAPPAGPAAPA